MGELTAQSIELADFTAETSCMYNGEEYNVRDNGAVLRLGRLGKRSRPLDNIWTFGNPSKSDGYMSIASHKVHRIVAIAFHGAPPTKSHVVDHIDTNRRNNRPENLRWGTRLENILLNPVTAKRIEYLYGSMEEFLADPRSPKNGKLTSDFEWMRTVTLEEAKCSRERMLNWARSDGSKSNGSLGDWIFNRSIAIASKQPLAKPPEQLVQSETNGAMQRNWRVPAKFPLCPDVTDRTPLETYFRRLQVGATAVASPFNETVVRDAAITDDKKAVFILGYLGKDEIKSWSLSCITFENKKFVHESCGTFFTEEGAFKQFTISQGKSWEGGDTMDDFC